MAVGVAPRSRNNKETKLTSTALHLARQLAAEAPDAFSTP
jgi:hypothetical protein